MIKALCIGRSVYSIVTEVENFPNPDSENVINNFVSCGSGSACNVAYLLGKYKVDSYLGSVVGDDTFGQKIKKELEAIYVHTEYMETAYEKTTPFSLIEVGPNNERITTMVDSGDLFLKKTEFQFEPDVIYVDGYDYGAALAVLNRYADKKTIIGARKCSQDIVELCKYCKYIIMSKEFAEWASNSKIDFDNPGSLVNVYSILLNKFIKKEILITLGDKGTLYISNNQIKVMPPIDTKPKDRTGAGDIFKGAFIYGLIQDYDIEKAVTFANIAASLGITKLGTRDAMPEMSDILTYFNQKYPETPAEGSAPAPAEAPAEQTPAPAETASAATTETTAEAPVEQTPAPVEAQTEAAPATSTETPAAQ